MSALSQSRDARAMRLCRKIVRLPNSDIADALAKVSWALLNLCDAIDHGTTDQIKNAVIEARTQLKD